MYAFAEQVLHGGAPLPVFEQTACAELGREFALKTNLQDAAQAHAELYYITQPMSYCRTELGTKMEQEYLHAQQGAVLENGVVKVRVPQEACAYFIELWQGELMTSSPLVEFK